MLGVIQMWSKCAQTHCVQHPIAVHHQRARPSACSWLNAAWNLNSQRLFSARGGGDVSALLLCGSLILAYSDAIQSPLSSDELDPSFLNVYQTPDVC